MKLLFSSSLDNGAAWIAAGKTVGQEVSVFTPSASMEVVKDDVYAVVVSYADLHSAALTKAVSRFPWVRIVVVTQVPGKMPMVIP